MPLAPTTLETEVCILGAGPHGLAAAVHLRRADPDLELVVVDPSGEWLTAWCDQFARAEIDALRSPIVHHPAPDPFELSDHIDRNGLSRSGLPYDPPVAEVFTSFCRRLIEEADLPTPLAGRVESTHRDDRGVHIQIDGTEVVADHLVVATNPHRRTIPDWVWPLLGNRPGLIRYGADVDLRTTGDLDGQRIVVVGGGLTAAHLAVGAVGRGADVELVARRALETRDFDTDPGWLGPRFLRDFDEDDDPVSRLDTARRARGGGTIPRWMRTRLDELIDDGAICCREGRIVRAADVDADGTAVLALDDQTTLAADQVWLATGTTPDIEAARCLQGITDDVAAIDGYPITDELLRLGPHPVHIMGRLATLTLGPAAGNLWGAQRAATRIAFAITGVDLRHESVVPVTPPPGPSTRTRPR